jgi:hypothetical protein
MTDKSIDFLLENAGPVIQYRLRKEILRNSTKTEEENLLERITQTPHFKLVESYVKPSGIIGGLSIMDKDKETRLQDCEAAARLLSNYAVPKSHPIVSNFVAALRDEEILREELRFDDKWYGERFESVNNGNALMSVIYVMQAMMGYGDDHDDLRGFQEICLKGFRRVLGVSSLNDIIKRGPKLRNNTPYIESDEFYPNMYTLAMLAYTRNWRTPENVKMMADFFNHLDAIAEPGGLVGGVSRLVNGRLRCTSAAFTSPLRPFSPDILDIIVYRRLLTETAMLGVGESADVIAESAFNIHHAIDSGGILRLRFDLPHNKHYSPRYLEFPTKYADVRLEPVYEPRKREPVGLLCDLTFWAVQFLTLVEGSK